jgi:hypothetical protein
MERVVGVHRTSIFSPRLLSLQDRMQLAFGRGGPAARTPRATPVDGGHWRVTRSPLCAESTFAF